MLFFEETKQKLYSFEADINDLYDAIGVGELKEQVKALEEQTTSADFWNDLENSQKVLQKIKQYKDKIENYQRLKNLWEDTIALIDIALEEKSKIDFVDVGELNSLFEASNIIYKIQVVDINAISEKMRENILRDRLIWKK